MRTGMNPVWRVMMVVSLVWCGEWSQAWAEQRVIVTDDAPIAIEVSSQGMTVIKLPKPVRKVYSSMKNVAIEPAGLNVVVSKVRTTGDLVVITDDDVAYTFQLQPVKVSAQSVRVEDLRRRNDSPEPQDDVIVKESSGFVSQLVNLTRVFARGDVPRGYESRPQEEVADVVPSWVGLAIEQANVFDGPAYTVLFLILRNQTAIEHTLHGWEWNGPDVLGVSMNRDHVLPGERARVLVFRERAQSTKEGHGDG